MGIGRALFRTARDISTFGPAILLRRFLPRGENGEIAISTSKGRFYMRPTDSDMEVLRQVFALAEFDLSKFPQMRRIHEEYLDCLSNGETPIIIDAGANIGAASLWFSKVFPDAKIYAVEPDPDNARLCRRNCEGRGNIEIIEAGLGAEPGRVSLAKHDNASWGIQTERRDDGEIPIVTVPQISARAGAKGRLFIVKIDIEGFERDLFSSSTEWVSEPEVIILELHDWMLPGRRSSRQAQRVMFAQNREVLISGENLVFVR